MVQGFSLFVLRFIHNLAHLTHLKGLRQDLTFLKTHGPEMQRLLCGQQAHVTSHEGNILLLPSAAHGAEQVGNPLERDGFSGQSAIWQVNQHTYCFVSATIHREQLLLSASASYSSQKAQCTFLYTNIFRPHLFNKCLLKFSNFVCHFLLLLNWCILSNAIKNKTTARAITTLSNLHYQLSANLLPSYRPL